jgi:hypothetical protein
MMHQHRQALTPSLYGLAAQTARGSLVPMLLSTVRRDKPRSDADLSSDFVHADTNREDTITQTSCRLKRQDFDIMGAHAVDA